MICDLLIDGYTAHLPTEARGIRATAVVTVPALALLSDKAAMAADLPVVEGIGPIPVSIARELCGGDASWMRVLTHPETGMVLSVGRDQYPPPAPLRRLVKWRADRCMGPGCGMPASRCQIDHQRRLGRRRTHLTRQPRTALPRAPHRPAPRQLGDPANPRQRRRHRMDLPHRPPLHRPTRTQSPRLHHRPHRRRRTRRTLLSPCHPATTPRPPPPPRRGRSGRGSLATLTTKPRLRTQ